MHESKSFDAVIMEGRIYHEENLRPWEGREVQVTLQVRTAEAALPDGLDVEKDVYLKMPVNTVVVQAAKVRDFGHARPSMIIPEGCEDE